MNRSIIILFFILSVVSVGAQNGKLLSKQLVDLSQTPVWEEIAVNDTLMTDFKYLDRLNFYFITYLSDSLEVKGILAEPKAEGKYPVVIFNRGGNRNFAPLTVAAMVAYVSVLAEQGYVVVGSNYREKDEFGGAEINDVLCLTETAKEIEKANPDCIGMYGWSRGGMMTYLALQKSDKIKTAIVGNGPADLFGTISDRPEMETNVIAECIPGYQENKEAELMKRSAIYWADKLNKSSSLLILCGTRDQRVNPQQAERMTEKLEEIRYDVELRKADTDHFFSDKRAELNEWVIEWFNKELKDCR